MKRAAAKRLFFSCLEDIAETRTEYFLIPYIELDGIPIDLLVTLFTQREEAHSDLLIAR